MRSYYTKAASIYEYNQKELKITKKMDHKWAIMYWVDSFSLGFNLFLLFLRKKRSKILYWTKLWCFLILFICIISWLAKIWKKKILHKKKVFFSASRPSSLPISIEDDSFICHLTHFVWIEIHNKMQNQQFYFPRNLH